MFGVGKLPLIGLENMIWHRGKGQQCKHSIKYDCQFD